SLFTQTCFSRVSLVIALVGNGNLIAWLITANDIGQLLWRMDNMSVNAGNDISGEQSGTVGCRAPYHFFYFCSILVAGLCGHYPEQCRCGMIGIVILK